MPILLFLCAGKRSFSSLNLPGVAFMPPDSDIIALALAEDIGSGDVTSKYFTSQQPVQRADCCARVLCRCRAGSGRGSIPPGGCKSDCQACAGWHACHSR